MLPFTGRSLNVRPVNVKVTGEGIAATVGAFLLDRAGFSVAIDVQPRPKLPAIMLGAFAQKLLEDVFEREDLFEGMIQIRKRVVAWGRTEPVEVPHEGVVVPEPVLLDRMRQLWNPRDVVTQAGAAWTIHSARPLPPPAREHQFGSRSASALAVELLPTCDKEACWIESLENGWLFLLPVSASDAWLLAVGSTPEALLDRSKLITKEISSYGESRGSFPCSPRIADNLCAEGWFACGTAAISFDPLCGDGAANAVREAILAAAAVRAITGGADSSIVLAHYRSRLQAGFQRHLELCRDFYSTGGSGAWWQREWQQLAQGVRWCEELRHSWTAPRFRLNGFELEAIQQLRAIQR